MSHGRDYCEGLRDSLDLVPIGAWYGNGRKVGWLSPFLLAAWDPATETFQSVCRCMSGFTDAFYQEVRLVVLEPTSLQPVRWAVRVSFWDTRDLQQDGSASRSRKRLSALLD